MALTVGVEHDLGALGEGVVVLRAHGRAVGARALDDDLVGVRVRVRLRLSERLGLEDVCLLHARHERLREGR